MTIIGALLYFAWRYFVGSSKMADATPHLLNYERAAHAMSAAACANIFVAAMHADRRRQAEYCGRFYRRGVMSAWRQ